MKRYGALATFAYVVLVFAAVWLGGLNQDEGWYLYAANLVREGKMLYRDFFYTQGPLLPLVYSPFAAAWRDFGLIGGRIVTAAIGLFGMLFAVALARLLAPDGRKGAAGVVAFMLLGCNLYHVYYLAIPKTYALASLFIMTGFFLMGFALRRCSGRPVMRAAFSAASGLCLALAAGARVSLGVMLAVAGVWLLLHCRRYGWSFAWFGLGGVVGLAAAYGPCIPLPGFREAIAYHLSRSGFDWMFVVGSLSRLVRWYLPIFILLGLVAATPALRRPSAERKPSGALLLLLSFLAVFIVQMSAPYPYEDYQVPVMGLLAVCSAVWTVRIPYVMILTLGLTWATSFGSPLLEKWTTNGHDRLWALKKEECELLQLQNVAKIIEDIDPGGGELLTQDTYIAIETGRKVPAGLEMGPFSMLSDDEWREMLSSAPCKVAAMSGYTFAVEPPGCDMRPMERQIEFWGMLNKRYDVVYREDAFGQNATPLWILKRKKGDVE